MKPLAVLFLAWLSSQCALAIEAPACVESHTFDADRILFVAPSAWYTNVGGRLFAIRGDVLATTINHNEPFMALACGSAQLAVGYSEGNKVFSFDGKTLEPLSLDFPGELSHTDGVIAYSSVIGDKNRYKIFVTHAGKSTEVESAALDAGLSSEGYFYASKEGGYAVYRGGHLEAAVENPSELIHLGVGYSNYARCGSDGLFFGREEDTYYLRSGNRLAKVKIPDGILKVEAAKGCAEQLILRDKVDSGRRVLWSLKFGRQATWTRIPTVCEPDSFSLDNDGSLFYRCGASFYFLPHSRKQSRLLGKLEIPGGQGGRDRWLATPEYGTLFAHVSKNGAAPQKVCFARLLPGRIVNIGGTEGNALAH